MIATPHGVLVNHSECCPSSHSWEVLKMTVQELFLTLLFLECRPYCSEMTVIEVHMHGFVFESS